MAKAKEKPAELPTLDVKLKTADLLKAVNTIMLAVERRTTIPILNYVAIEPAADGIQLRSNDLDMEVVTRVHGEVDGIGALALPARRLRDILRVVSHIPDLTIRMDDSGRAHLTAGNITAVLFSLPADELPRSNTTAAPAFTALIGEGALDWLISGVWHAVSNEETRYYLNGVAIEVDEDKVLAIATDGHRLATRSISLSAPVGKHAVFIVPRAAVAAVRTLAKGRQVEMSLLGRGHARFAFGETVFSTKLIDGTYPDWRRVVPKLAANTVDIEIADIRRAEALMRVRGDVARPCRVAPDGDGVTLSANDPGEGEVSLVLPTTIAGTVPSFGVNPKYLADSANALAGTGATSIRLHVENAGDPIIAMPVGRDVAGEMHLLMPMRV
ncbi:DNA polymerase III subunit beta [uncultured Enterovirga sp.]|uniref:DNA polymerase III subunit beta n=1 Tax=uncultured Enterovirga sp. TaxID=2026352 RepID=UPI0035CA0D29